MNEGKRRDGEHAISRRKKKASVPQCRSGLCRCVPDRALNKLAVGLSCYAFSRGKEAMQDVQNPKIFTRLLIMILMCLATSWRLPV